MMLDAPLSMLLPSPPAPSDPADILRWTHSRLRRRLLYSEHEADLVERIRAHVGSTRRAAWGEPDLSANPYLSLWEQTSRLYAEVPEVRGMPETVKAATSAGLWSLMQRVQRDTLGLRETLVRVEVIDDKPVYTLLYPDLVEARASAAEPGQPIWLRESRYDADLGIWVRVTWDSESQVPAYYATSASDGTDVSENVLGGRYVGDAYPYRDASDRPVVPAVVYHAAETGRLWDPYTGREIVEGSLTLGMLLTYWGHVVRSCAWSQRYAVGVLVDGGDVEIEASGAAARREIVTDPATLLMLRADEGAGQPTIGQWAPPVSPEELIKSIRSYEERLVEAAGLRVDVTRQSSDIRSGYSLAVAREAIREAQRVYEPLFARSDARLLWLTAWLLRQPDEPLTIRYLGLPQSPAERRQAVDEVIRLREAGLISRVEAWLRLHPGATDDEARAALAEIEAENRQEVA
jgi:hypothetical protein